MTKRTFAAINGVSSHISINNEQILFDLGLVRWRFKRNMKLLNINPDEIDKIFISHGHMDHTRGLKPLLKKRTNANKIILFSHPAVREPKRAFYHGIKLWNAGFPEIHSELEKKVEFRFNKKPVEIAPNLFTSGEVPLKERAEEQNLGKLYWHKLNGKWEHDPLIDEQFLILKAKEGSVIISGCGHIGILNTLRIAEEKFNDKVIAVIGGIHLIFAKKEKVFRMADKLMQRYGEIKFYLNHSIGTNAFKLLVKKMGKEKIERFSVGDKLTFDF